MRSRSGFFNGDNWPSRPKLSCQNDLSGRAEGPPIFDCTRCTPPGAAQRSKGPDPPPGTDVIGDQLNSPQPAKGASNIRYASILFPAGARPKSSPTELSVIHSHEPGRSRTNDLRFARRRDVQ